MDEPERKRVAAELEQLPPERWTETLEEFQPYDLSQLVLEVAPSTALRMLAALPPEQAGETLEHLEPDKQFDLLKELDEPVSRAILEAMGADAVADLVQSLLPKEGQEVLRHLPEEELGEVRRLLSYPESSAGGRMTVDFFAVRQGWTCGLVIEHFRRVGRDVEVAHYVYVVDRERRLVGVTSMRDAILADPSTPVSEIMHSAIVSVPADMDQEQVARTMADYDFGAIPVVDSRNRIVGVVSADDIFDVLEEEATEDFQRIGGTEPLDEPYLSASMFDLFRKRIVWLLILFAAATVTQNILAHYSGMLEAVVALAFFIPLLIGTGGNAGAQAGTLVIRAMAVGEVTFADFLRVVWREARLGLLLGLAMGAVALVWSVLLNDDASLGLTVAVAIAVVVLWTSTLGASLPLIGRRLGFDPAVFSAPLITTLADATGLIIYFQLARYLIGA